MWYKRRRRRLRLLAAALVIIDLSFFAAGSYQGTQRQRLESLYNATAGAFWTNSTGWRSSGDICSWQGVECDAIASVNVTGLWLGSNNLSGTLENAILLWEVESLTALDFHDNLLSGSVPMEIASLGELAYLDLSDNSIVGEVPAVLGEMGQLQTLNLGRNLLNSIPDDWGTNATALRHLFLQQNAISGSLPSAWLQLNGSSSQRPLVHLNATAEASRFPALQTLLLAGNNLTQDAYEVLQAAATWPQLSALDLRDNSLNGTLDGVFTVRYCIDAACESDAVAVADGFPSLTLLMLGGNKLTGPLPSSLAASRLALLDVSRNNFSGALPEAYMRISVLAASQSWSWYDGGSGAGSFDALPSFLGVYTATAAAEAAEASSTDRVAAQLVVDRNFSCPAFRGEGLARGMRVMLDAEYLGYSHCGCVVGMQRSALDNDTCVPCPVGTYGSSFVDGWSPGAACRACPLYSTTTIAGATSVLDCVCGRDTYLSATGETDTAAECAACPSGSYYAGTGATNASACTCGKGLWLSFVDSDGGGSQDATCAACPAGTYKTIAGNDVKLCLACPAGSYSSVAGATAASACQACPAGTYGDATAAAAASAGVGATSAASACQACPAGTYSDQTGLTSSALCRPCPAGHYQSGTGAVSADACVACGAGTYSTDVGAASASMCKSCPSELFSIAGSPLCWEVIRTRELLLYLIVGACTLAGLGIALGGWHMNSTKGGGHMPKPARPQQPNLYRAARAKRAAMIWSISFLILETADVLTSMSLFGYLVGTDGINGPLLSFYCAAVSFGLLVTVYRVFAILRYRYMLKSVWVERRRAPPAAAAASGADATAADVVVVFAEKGPKSAMRERLTASDSRIVSEFVKLLKMLQVSKFKVRLALALDLPLTGLNLYTLRFIDGELTQNSLFLASLTIAVFSAGKLSTQIEYHLELRHRKRKLEELLQTDINRPHTERNKPEAAENGILLGGEGGGGLPKDDQENVSFALWGYDVAGSPEGEGEGERLPPPTARPSPQSQQQKRRSRSSAKYLQECGDSAFFPRRRLSAGGASPATLAELPGPVPARKRLSANVGNAGDAGSDSKVLGTGGLVGAVNSMAAGAFATDTANNYGGQDEGLPAGDLPPTPTSPQPTDSLLWSRR